MMRMNEKPWFILTFISFIAVLVTSVLLLQGCVLNGTCHGVTPQSQLEGPVKQEWVAHYHAGDAKAVAVDKNGDICVTGSGGTIKYNSAGQELWDATLSFTSDVSMAIDTEGNIYVAGLGGKDSNYITELSVVKYSADGKQLWSSNRVADHYYQWVSLALDKQGNAYVAVDVGYYVNNSVGIFKYSGIDGTELWMASYERPYDGPEAPSVVVDGSGNLYLAGADELVKYSSEGIELWSIRLDEVAGKTWVGCSLALDQQGNIYVSPSSYRISKYDTNGRQIWTISYDSIQASIVLDGSGNIYASGGGKITKYSTGGTLLWSIVGTGGLAVDSAGNIYVTSLDGKWWLTRKYSSSGTEVWTARYWDGAEGYVGDIWSEPTGIAVDALGNVYVTGKSTYQVCGGGLEHIDSGSLASSEYTTIKYSKQ